MGNIDPNLFLYYIHERVEFDGFVVVTSPCLITFITSRRKYFTARTTCKGSTHTGGLYSNRDTSRLFGNNYFDVSFSRFSDLNIWMKKMTLRNKQFIISLRLKDFKTSLTVTFPIIFRTIILLNRKNWIPSGFLVCVFYCSFYFFFF